MLDASAMMITAHRMKAEVMTATMVEAVQLTEMMAYAEDQMMLFKHVAMS